MVGWFYAWVHKTCPPYGSNRFPLFGFDGHVDLAIGEPGLAVLDVALQLHVAPRHGRQRGAGLGGEGDDGEVVEALQAFAVL